MADSTKANANWPDPDLERAQPGDVLGSSAAAKRRALAKPRKTKISRRRKALEDPPEKADA